MVTEQHTFPSGRRLQWPSIAAALVAAAAAVAWLAGVRTSISAPVALVATGVAIGHVLAVVRIRPGGSRPAAAPPETTHELRTALAAKTLLLQEIHHRVKNQLAMMSSLLNIKAEATTSRAVRDALLACRQRLESVALVHEHLHRGEHLDRVQFASYGEELVADLRAALLDEMTPIRIETAFDPIELAMEQAVPCALIVNELVTNALKHAFPNGRRGTICLSLREAMPGMLELTVADDGVGLPRDALASPPGSGSLGLRIVSLLTQQLGGAVQQRRGSGTAVVLRFPRVAAPRASAVAAAV
jgi:two-component sensor histidine kinase